MAAGDAGSGLVLLTEEEWEALEDPEFGKYEIIDGELVVSPSPDAVHNRFGEDLADIVRLAIDHAALDYDVTIDVEWRVVEDGRVRQAPRGDLVVGRVDPDKDIHLQVPLFVVEVWDPASRPGVRNRRRAYWAAQGVQHYWQVLVTVPAIIEVYDLSKPLAPLQQVTGSNRLSVTQPFPLAVVPDEVVGWTHRQLRQAEADRNRAEAEAARAEAEAARADAAEARVAELEAELARRAAADPTEA